MLKPEQRKKLFERVDNDDLLDSIEGAMSSIAEAMGCLRGIYDFCDWFDTLGDIYDEMKPLQEQYENIASAEYAKEIEGLTRQYYGSVL